MMRLNNPSTLNYLFLIVPFSIAMPSRAGSMVVVLISLLTVYLTVKSPVHATREFFRTPLAILILLQFAIVALGFINSPDHEQGWSDLERTSFLLACLVLIYQMKNSGATAFQSLIAFTTGCMLLTLGGLAYVFVAMDREQRSEVFQYGHTSFTDFLDIHPTYLSIYFILIFFFLADTLRTDRSLLQWYTKVGILFVGVYAIGMLILLRSQMGLLIFVMLLVLYVIVVLKRRAWLVAFALFTTGLLVFLLDSHRVTTFFDTYGKNVSTAIDERYLVWRGTLEGIKTAPIFGVGTGGEQQLINAGYERTGYVEGIRNSYNAHNQYLQFLVRNGVLELGCFLVFLVYIFRRSLAKTNFTFLMFNMAVTLIMFAESFLSVQRGIVFFYFFSCAFVCLPYKSDSAVKDV